MKLKSVTQESILKQFYIFFLLAAVIPFIVFVYILIQLGNSGAIISASINTKTLLIIAGFFLFLGFWGTRSFLVKIVLLSNKLKSHNLENLDKIDKNTIMELAQGDEEVAHLAKAFSDIIANLENNINKLKEAKTTLYQVLSRIGKTVESSDNFDMLIKFILETIVDALGAKRGAIFLLDKEANVLKPKTYFGIEEKFIPAEVKLGKETVGWVVASRKSLLVPMLESNPGDSLFSAPLIAAPLMAHDNIFGAICISGKKNNESFSDEELGILTNLAYQIAVSVENVDLNAEVEKIYFETIAALALAVEAKDPYSRGHSERVAKFALKIAESLSLGQDDLSILRDAAKLHDIGKIGIMDQILHKPGKLSHEEGLIMHKHPEIGEGIVKPLRNFQHIIDPIKHHHEFLDGSGYPDGLKDAKIPLVTRILTVADIYDAMISDRPYRNALTIDQAKKELRDMVALGKIDQEIVASLFRLIESGAMEQ
jgi:HD-GYP domain-containing protein (c-di-GMP phosphodiesterase class II)